MSSTDERKTTMETPQYLHASSTDDLARMITGLTEELWVLRDRVMLLERAVVDAGVLAADTVDELVPDAELGERLATERMRLIRRVLGAPLDARV
ncbi:hypothetical protein [Nocardioides sp. W7]|uniref:hypothetical protein n=1 Tax=Nocardioides sp. W7 TaxID=2931390 RepID=UPI001FD4CED3|nr:hypothetical protein [Nocardioides sp. W7]